MVRHGTLTVGVSVINAKVFEGDPVSNNGTVSFNINRRDDFLVYVGTFDVKDTDTGREAAGALNINLLK